MAHSLPEPCAFLYLRFLGEQSGRDNDARMPVPAVTIRPRRSMVLVALFSIAMVILSYVFVLALAALCVFLPYWLMTSTESANGQLVLLFLFGIAIAGAILWSLFPRPDKFKAPGPVLENLSSRVCLRNWRMSPPP